MFAAIIAPEGILPTVEEIAAITSAAVGFELLSSRSKSFAGEISK